MEVVVADALAVRDRPTGKLRRPRVLLVAYACSPEQGSEPGVGWNRAIETARFCDTWVICEEHRYGPAVRRHLEAYGPIPGLNFVFVPKVTGLQWLRIVPGFDYLFYNAWQRRARDAARRLHADVQFDLVHQVTFCSYREPGYLWQLGVPFVWGPVGGTQNYPWRFLGQAEPTGAVREVLRGILNRLQLHFSTRIRSAARSAAAVLAANSTVQHDLARVCGRKPLLQLETGVRAVGQVGNPSSHSSSTLHILWSGEFRCWKALPLLIQALAQLPPDVAYKLTLLGSGPLERRWRRMAQQFGVDAQFHWLGWLPHSKAMEQYANADVLAFTSLRDTSGNVVLEALAQGLPVICLDHQGVRDIVTPDCGIKVPVTKPREVIAGLAQAITKIARDPACREKLARGASARAGEYLWTLQGERMADVYRQVLNGKVNYLPINADVAGPA